MHTFVSKYCPDVRFHHNGDFSGNVNIVNNGPFGVVEISVPSDALLEFLVIQAKNRMHSSIDAIADEDFLNKLTKVL